MQERDCLEGEKRYIGIKPRSLGDFAVAFTKQIIEIGI